MSTICWPFNCVDDDGLVSFSDSFIYESHKSAGCFFVGVKSMIFVVVKLGHLSGCLSGRFDWFF